MPLENPIPLQAFAPNNITTNGTGTTEAKTTNTTDSGEEVAESILVENSRLLPNEVPLNETKPEVDTETTTTDVPTTTDPATTTVSS